jgi:hypothetical protein
MLTPKFYVQDKQSVNVPELITGNRTTFFNAAAGGGGALLRASECEPNTLQAVN